MSDIYKGNNCDVDLVVTKRSARSGKMIPAPGLIDLYAWISANPQGDPINPDLKVLAVEAADVPGTYTATISRAAIDTHLFDVNPSYDGSLVYVVAESESGEV